MLLILIFRVSLLLAFLIVALKFGDWKNREKYYPTVLFVIVADLFASFLTYHHILWNYNPDILVKTRTTVELCNSFFMLPITAFIFLSRYPKDTKLYQYGYIVFWVFIYAGLEFIDHYIVGGLSYKNGWSWLSSVVFDCCLFPIVRLHHLNPGWAWVVSLVMTIVILIMFDFSSGEFK